MIHCRLSSRTSWIRDPRDHTARTKRTTRPNWFFDVNDLLVSGLTAAKLEATYPPTLELPIKCLRRNADLFGYRAPFSTLRERASVQRKPAVEPVCDRPTRKQFDFGPQVVDLVAEVFSEIA